MRKRTFLGATVAALPTSLAAAATPRSTSARAGKPMPPTEPPPLTLFLCGDVMTGRGIDQVLPHPVDPTLHEPYATSALDYVELAERAYGPIPRPVDVAYVWGDALPQLDRAQPDLRIINLETSVTRSATPCPKGINYRMSPENIGCLTALGADACSLANNHVLDWGRPGLAETLSTLRRAGLATAGAGLDAAAAAAPAVLDAGGKGRVILLAFGTGSSGIPHDWAASPDRPGVRRLDDLGPATVAAIAGQVRALGRKPRDVVLASIHWGGNWGHDIPAAQIGFAHALIDEAGIDLVHGHSSHHPKAIEVHRGKLVLYGCGDFLNDYEGIGGHEAYRPDLALGYVATLSPTSGKLQGLRMTPFRIRHFRLERAPADDRRWLAERLSRVSRPFGTTAGLAPDGTLALQRP